MKSTTRKKRLRAELLLIAICLFSICVLAGDLTVDDLTVRGNLEVAQPQTGGSVPTNGLVLYYDFNDDEGGIVTDDSGNNNNATVIDATWTTNGISGGAYSLDGNGDYINIGASPNFPAWANYTVSVWFLNDGGGNQALYGQKLIDKTVMMHDWHIRLNTYSTGIVLFQTYEGGSGTLQDNTQDFRDTNWHHVVVTKQGSAGELWVDGELRDSGTLKTVFSNGDLVLGYSLSSDSYQRRYWSGMIDEVAIYDRKLSSEEVTSLYLREGPAPEPTGEARFHEGIEYLKPKGDLPMGVYTNTP